MRSLLVFMLAVATSVSSVLAADVYDGETIYINLGEKFSADVGTDGGCVYACFNVQEGTNLSFDARGQWLSPHLALFNAAGEELEAFRRQAHRDWRQILLHRATELKPGGKLILINFGCDEQGRYLGNTGGVNMFDTFNQIWLDFVEHGRIEREEYENMTLPQYYNTVEEFSAPLTDPDDAVYQAGLRLEHIDTRIVKCPFAEAFAQHGDAARFAEEYIPTIRSWNESTYFNALSGQRSLEQRRQIIEDYYASYGDLVRNNPDGHGMDYVHAYMVISKVS